IAPVPAAKQREALKFIAENILSDKSFKFSPSMLRKLTTERWYHWGNDGIFSGGGAEFPINDEILAIQKIVLGQCLDAGVLNRLENEESQADPGAAPFRMAESFRPLTDGIWTECAEKPGTGPDGKPTVACSTIRRNLQREYLRRLATIVVGNNRNGLYDRYAYVYFFGGQSYPADASSLARHHLKETNDRIARTLEMKDVNVDETTRAHLEECRQRIAKALDARPQSIDL